MRRLLILLLMLVVPLKSWTAVALPHAAGAGHLGAMPIEQAGPVSGENHDHGADGGKHDHGAVAQAEPQAQDCPHLTMPLHAAAAPVIAWPEQAFPPLAGRATTPASVVLDVLLPPPLALR